MSSPKPSRRHRPDAELQGELGDVLLQVVLHARLAEERGAFDLDDVAADLTAKMIRRNPHVFRPGRLAAGLLPGHRGGDRAFTGTRSRRAERPERTDPFAGLPRHLPALVFADKALGRGERWLALENGAGGPDAPGEAAFLNEAPAPEGDPGRDLAVFANEEELGEHLLGIVRAARAGGLDAERALRAAVVRHTETGWRAPR